jgi:beta-glucanase (GH16 family)
MFTYRDSSDPAEVQEADIEILTRDPRNKIQYTNQPSDLPEVGEVLEATRNATIPGDRKWSDWAVHRLDWTSERSTWYVDGEEAANIEFQVPRDAASINFNAWGDGGSWSGNMSVGGEASLQIQWIEVLYNTTTTRKRDLLRMSSKSEPKARNCVVCGVDQGYEAGYPVLLSNNTGTASQVVFAANGWLSSLFGCSLAFSVGVLLWL